MAEKRREGKGKREGRKEKGREGKGERKGRKEKGREGKGKRERKKKKEEKEEKRRGKNNLVALPRKGQGRIHAFFFLLNNYQEIPFRGNPLSGQRIPFQGIIPLTEGGCHKTPRSCLVFRSKERLRGVSPGKKHAFFVNRKVNDLD